MSYNFRAWLKVQPANKEYNFMDCTGKCAVGQWMASRGEKWDMPEYTQHIVENFSGTQEFQALSKSKTFGELKRKLELLDA